MFFRLPIVKFFSRLLNRATITVALVLLQAGWLLWAFSYLTTGRIWVNAALRLLSLFIVLYLVRKDEDSSYKIIWIVLIGLLPLLGGLIGVYNFYQVVLTLTGQTELFGRLKDMLLIQVLYLILIYII